jgi:hypothetical protein
VIFTDEPPKKCEVCGFEGDGGIEEAKREYEEAKRFVPDLGPFREYDVPEFRGPFLPVKLTIGADGTEEGDEI